MCKITQNQLSLGIVETTTNTLKIMTIYQCLLELNELGYLKPLMNKGVISLHYVQWMQIYAYHLVHPKLSHFELSLDLNISKSTIQRALSFMNQPLN